MSWTICRKEPATRSVRTWGFGRATRSPGGPRRFSGGPWKCSKTYSFTRGTCRRASEMTPAAFSIRSSVMMSATRMKRCRGLPPKTASGCCILASRYVVRRCRCSMPSPPPSSCFGSSGCSAFCTPTAHSRPLQPQPFLGFGGFRPTWRYGVSSCTTTAWPLELSQTGWISVLMPFGPLSKGRKGPTSHMARSRGQYCAMRWPPPYQCALSRSTQTSDTSAQSRLTLQSSTKPLSSQPASQASRPPGSAPGGEKAKELCFLVP
mmetsp:Transcript_71822/g.210921  ORF Transcript_71822/g.210921 Transcript_71822/m.210921 type:complete len:263 (+) Transcript_71822:112-900(+)